MEKILSYHDLDVDGNLIAETRSDFRKIRRNRAAAGYVDPIYLVVQEISRCYGGPEEGGWWYDVAVNVAVRKCYTWQSALRIMRELKEEYPQPKYSRGSVLGSGDYEFFICHCEENFPTETTERPHYE